MLRSLLRKWLRYLLSDTAGCQSAKVFPKMGFRPDTFMLRTEPNMSGDNGEHSGVDDQWIYEIVPHEQIESMNDKAEQIERNMDNGISIVLTADNQSAIEMCQAWQKSLRGDFEAAFKITVFMSSIIKTIEVHLSEEGIDPYED